MSTMLKTSMRKACQVDLELEAQVEREGREVSSSESSITVNAPIHCLMRSYVNGLNQKGEP